MNKNIWQAIANLDQEIEQRELSIMELEEELYYAEEKLEEEFNYYE